MKNSYFEYLIENKPFHFFKKSIKCKVYSQFQNKIPLKYNN